jgi:outer membrane murein-binding lipoprotein Lpp
MKAIQTSAYVVAALLIGGCASNTERTSKQWAQAMQSAETSADHEKLAEHYDEMASTMQANAEAERSSLTDYQLRPYRYGKRIKDLRARSTRLVHDYEMAASDNRQMADFHRQRAAELR